MLKVLPTFSKHVITIDLDNLRWILKFDTKFSLLDRWIAYVVTKLNVDAMDCCKWKQNKISTHIYNQQYQRYECKKIKVQNKKP